MDIFNIKDMTAGWFIGDFEPTAYSTKDFEVSYRVHQQGEEWETHYHKVGTEINLLISGQMTLQDKTLTTGDIFIIHPYEIADPVFLEPCAVLCIKTPSSPGDKYVIENVEEQE
tara:strand:- start:112 stop:453 length:342 start_codon:yes stop_codon:yes gene_type:complete